MEMWKQIIQLVSMSRLGTAPWILLISMNQWFWPGWIIGDVLPHSSTFGLRSHDAFKVSKNQKLQKKTIG